MRKSTLGIAAAVLAAFALAACGDDDGGGGVSSDDQDQITAAIEAAAISGDSAACTDAQTQQFTEQTTGKTGEAAVTACENGAEDTVADSAEVSNIDGDEDAATAEVAFTGNVFDGQTVGISLVKDGDQWKLDEATGFKDFDRDAFIADLRESLASEEGAPQGAADCVAENLQGLSDDQIDDLFLNSDKDLEKQVFDPCFKGE
jgi:hypothetical protein